MDKGKASISVNYIETLDEWLRNNGVDRDDVCLIGSSALAVRGLRENHDLEFVIKPKIRKKLELNRRRDFLWLTFHIDVDEGVELWKNQLFRIGVTDRRIFSERLYDRIGGYNVIFLDIEKLYKQEIGREKDFEDIKKIDSFNHKIKYRRRIYDRVCRILLYFMEHMEFRVYNMRCKLMGKLRYGGIVKDDNIHIILWP